MDGWTLARAHARSGDRIAIAAYLGGSDVFDRAITQFAAAYADQNEPDHQVLVGLTLGAGAEAAWYSTCSSSGSGSPWSRFR